jgi:hypothetical protein
MMNWTISNIPSQQGKLTVWDVSEKLTGVEWPVEEQKGLSVKTS